MPRKSLTTKRTTTSKLFSCTKCTKKFKEKSKFKRHMKETHSDAAEEFGCTFCCKKFKRREHLNRHLRGIHFQQKYKCPLCPSEHVEKTRLKKHLKTVHGLCPCLECGVLCSDETNHNQQFCDEKYTCLTSNMAKHGILFHCDDCLECFLLEEDKNKHFCLHAQKTTSSPNPEMVEESPKKSKAVFQKRADFGDSLSATAVSEGSRTQNTSSIYSTY